MKYFALLLTLLQCSLTFDVSAQPTSPTEESCRLTMVIPSHFVRAGQEEGVVKYRSKKNKTSLTMTKDYKDAQDGFLTAQAAADQVYKELIQKGNVTALSVVNEKIGKTEFVTVSWLEHSQNRGAALTL